jgi:hypothetical protein
VARMLELRVEAAATRIAEQPKEQPKARLGAAEQRSTGQAWVAMEAAAGARPKEPWAEEA